MAVMNRRKSREIFLGNIGLGGDNPIRVQSMTNTKTEAVDASIDQIKKLYDAGCEVVRLAITSSASCEALGYIRSKLKADGLAIPLVADVHFSQKIAFEALKYADKVRINPGNFLHSDRNLLSKARTKNIANSFGAFVIAAKNAGKSIRIGVNQGSLDGYIIKNFGRSSLGLVESAVEFATVAVDRGFRDMVFSFKSSYVPSMVEAYEFACQRFDKIGFDFPMHVGVTEAGDGSLARVKSAIGIGSLLLKGIGDTIRVSITGDPVNEIGVAYEILQSCGVRKTMVEYVACPSCGRTQFDIEKTLRAIKLATSRFYGSGLKIAVMGCIVNGIGEMGDADFGYVGGLPGRIDLYKAGRCVKRAIDEKDAVNELVALISFGQES
ncbi:MAG: (E)-4-hydroxy-3-methylbut-2-enyl-diphosphate synthase [Puniceicoccales bacterium]|nr:(E)-4-hydroxy-3-methylbut-2-enyl-diphosphate synthase [Puniceicoccales bacterium]